MSDFRKWLLCRNRCCLRKFLEDLVLTGSKECNLRMSGALLKFFCVKKPVVCLANASTNCCSVTFPLSVQWGVLQQDQLTQNQLP